MQSAGKEFEVQRGTPLPLGSTIKRGGVNFAVFSKHATSMSLVLYPPGKDQPVAEFNFDPRHNRTGQIWHVFIQGLDAGFEYGFRAGREPNDDSRIHRFDSSQVLIDPYARVLSGGEEWGEIRNPNGTLPDTPIKKRRRSLLVNYDFDWGVDEPLNTPLSESIIYELHVRGFTRHPSSCVANPGTYAGLVEKIPYLKDLGITAVELLPVDEFEETDASRINPITGERLLNFWGYNSLSFFSPKASYASNNWRGAQINEFKSMVKSFHHAGIEVILDVVLNHTAEGDERGQTNSFRGLDNDVYYMIDHVTKEYLNYSGCGNTLNCNHPWVREMIMDCLRYWVMEMRVDGFRFDLASILGRGRDGAVLANPPLLEAIAADPILADAKIIAEAWDAAGLYQVGTFPAWGRWAEWNGSFRDDLRRFVKSDAGMIEALANRLTGSPDIYEKSGRAPYHSINFITSHDGFTLADLVSYDQKHNEANGESNRDGDNVNNSWNCGMEGPTSAATSSDVPRQVLDEIDALRRRQIKNLGTLLIIARGTPMILAGDEMGRTQFGNNNAYCQDNEISWLNWDLLHENADIHRFFKLLIKFRKMHHGLRYPSFSDVGGEMGIHVTWHGVKPHEPDFSWQSRSLAGQISEHAHDESDRRHDIYVAVNSWWNPLRFALPALGNGRNWFRVIDTSLDAPRDIADEGDEEYLNDQKVYNVGPRSIVALIGRT